MSAVVRIRGEWVSLPKLVAHYRAMCRSDRKSAAFWRTRIRTVIASYREQAAQFERLAA